VLLINMLAGKEASMDGTPLFGGLRERVARAVIKGGLSRHQAAAQFGVGISTAINWVQRFHETGSVKPGQIGGYRPKKIAGPHSEWLMQRCRNDFTVRGLVAELAERGLKVDYRTMWEFVHAEKLSYKKDADCRRAGSPDVARRRAQWTKYRDRIDPARLVFVDEAWTKTNMAPLRVWAPRGQCIKAKVPHGPWQTMTFMAALRHDRITAPWFIEGPINGEAFLL
jgi:transposase